MRNPWKFKWLNTKSCNPRVWLSLFHAAFLPGCHVVCHFYLLLLVARRPMSVYNLAWVVSFQLLETTSTRVVLAVADGTRDNA